MTKLILIVEDDQNQRKILEYALHKAGYRVEGAASGHEALSLLSGDNAGRFSLVLLDMVIGTVTGQDVLLYVRENLSDLPVIVLTGHGSIDNAVEAMRDGAADFIAKPVEVDRLKVSIENALGLAKLSGEISRLSRKWSGHFRFEDLVGSSEAMNKAVLLAKRGAASNIPILLEGESGVGKEVFARAIQGESDRRDKPFVVINCGAIPRNLVESILFGHEKGAFTGAQEKHVGKFVEADGGTLFLDEIGELPLDLQVKLLRVLQEGEMAPVGSGDMVQVDVRLISATNRSLKDMVAEGSFREDLFYRLNIFPIPLPPLRDRKDDIEYLVPHFIENISISEGCPVREVSPGAMSVLKNYPWPGNVRQLENALFRAMILSEGPVIGVEDFPQITQTCEQEGHARAGVKDAMTGNSLSVLDRHGDIRPIHEVERDMIAFALGKYNGHMSEIARRLGLGRSTLYRKVAGFGLEAEAE